MSLGASACVFKGRASCAAHLLLSVSCSEMAAPRDLAVAPVAAPYPSSCRV